MRCSSTIESKVLDAGTNFHTLVSMQGSSASGRNLVAVQLYMMKRESYSNQALGTQAR